MRDYTDEKWYQYLYYTENIAVNMERVETVESITGRETLDYVLRTLAVLDMAELADEQAAYRLSDADYSIIRTVLQWSEVAKGGTSKDRAYWEKKGYPLDIHNIASAEIYLEEGVPVISLEDNCKSVDTEHAGQNPEHDGRYQEYAGQNPEHVGHDQEYAGKTDVGADPKTVGNIIYTLIKTHGMIGQCLRGEVPVSGNAPLLALPLEKDRLKAVLYLLNECIIRGVSDDLWNRVKPGVYGLIDRITEGDLSEFPAEQRVKSLLPGLTEIPDELVAFFREKLFPYYELWYFEAALSDFDASQVLKILTGLADKMEAGNARYISFKPLADSLYYDYEGKKRINVYKKRIIEKYLRDDKVGNVSLTARSAGSAVLVDLGFSKVCEKLIEFCVEAERSGLLTFEKSITVLYDMFGFRRDEFDRLNNEDKYLATMNDTEESTKNSIIDYAVGQTVVDVGSGGGVLLDLLEERYPDKTVIGTDISQNVIAVLNKKRQNENHHWTVMRHNFVDGPILMDGEMGCVDTIIFSSIIHEIFSYTETPEGRFRIEVVKKALENAFDSLRPGGRIIIRDGVKSPVTEGQDMLTVTFKDASGLEFFKNYLNDFEGLPDIEDKRITIDEEGLKVSGCKNYIREFLYTYTWGRESYSHEVQEQFGYFTIDEYREFLESLGAEVIRADSFLEPGYPEHLRPLVSLEPDIFPDSNCIVVAEKK